MAVPRFAPTPPIDDARGYESPPVVPDSWVADRPAEIIGFQPEGPRLGHQGPDQGYAIKLARTFADKVHLQAGERFDDAVGGSLGIALRRASVFSRAPVIHDLTIAFTIWGWLDPAAPTELLDARKGAVRGTRRRRPSLRVGPRPGRPGPRRHAADDAGAGDRGVPGPVARADRDAVMQDINLSDEQREFRAVMRRFAENEIAPNAAEIDRTGEYGWTSWEALKSMELTVAELPGGVRRLGGVAGRPGDRGRGAGPGVRLDEPGVPRQQAGDAAGDQLRLGVDEVDLPAEDLRRHVAGRLRVERARRRQRRRLDDHPRRAGRR